MDRILVKVLTYVFIAILAAGLGKSVGDLVWHSGFAFPVQITVFSLTTFAVLVVGVLLVENESKPVRALVWLSAKIVNSVRKVFNGLDWLAGGAGEVFVHYPRIVMYVNGKRDCVWSTEAKIPRSAELKGVGRETVEKARKGEIVTFYSDGNVEVMPWSGSFESKFK